MSKHSCHAVGCQVEVPPRLMMCRRHWRMVPVFVQRLTWDAYRPGQEIDKRPSRFYMAVQLLARAEVAAKEGKDQRVVRELMRRSIQAMLDSIERGEFDDVENGIKWASEFTDYVARRRESGLAGNRPNRPRGEDDRDA